MGSLLERAKDCESRNEWSQAAELYRQALGEAPQDRAILESLAWCLSRDRQHEQALECLGKLHERFPNEARWPYMIGYQYYDQEQWKDAIQWFEKALLIHKGFVVVLYRKGYAHEKLEEVGPALDSYSRCRASWHALADGPTKEKDRKNCAKAAYHQGSLILSRSRKMVGASADAAVEALQEAVQLEPKDGNYHYRLGAALLAASRAGGQ